MSSLNFDKLQLVQNTLARIVTLTRKRDQIRPSLKRLHWLPIRRRVDFKVALLTHSIRHSGKLQHLNSLLIDYKPTKSLRSAEEHLRTKLSSTSQDLPLDIRSCKIMSIFRKLLKTYLYKQACEHC